VSKVEAEGAASLASTHGEASELTQRVGFLEGELIDEHQAWDTTEVNFQELSYGAIDINRRWENVERQCQDLVQELTLLQTRGLSCAWP
jgi:hypothetical protein